MDTLNGTKSQTGTSQLADSQGSESSNDRWDPNILDDTECKNVWTETADAEEHLPEFFDPNVVQKRVRDSCALCGNVFKTLGNRRQHCRKCGESVCDPCS